jgi:hypothetical protein
VPPVVETFFGHSGTFWVGVEALGVCLNTLFVVLTLLFIYRQVRVAATAFQLDAIIRLQELVDDFKPDRTTFFTECPLDLALSTEQFADRPPARHKLRRMGLDLARKMALTPMQLEASGRLSEEVRRCGKRIIERLNDIGELVEDGFISPKVFFGKYHVMVIQCCYLVEAIRREEENRRGGAYGQRLLRLRHRAIAYNNIVPKHRTAGIKITQSLPPHLIVGEHTHIASDAPLTRERVIYRTPNPRFSTRIVWTFRRWLSLY